MQDVKCVLGFLMVIGIGLAIGFIICAPALFGS